MKVEWYVDGEGCIRTFVSGKEILTIDFVESGERGFGLWEKPEIEQLLLEQYWDYFPENPIFVMV